MSCNGVTSMGSNPAPITMSLPLGPRPSISADIAFGLGAGGRMLLPPPRPSRGGGRLRRCVTDVRAGADFFPRRRVSGAAPDGRVFVANFVCELNPEVTEPADTLHRDQVAGQRPTVPQR